MSLYDGCGTGLVAIFISSTVMGCGESSSWLPDGGANFLESSR